MELPSMSQIQAQNIRVIEADAYRFFFPLGWFLAVAGVFLWILFLYHVIDLYPKELHADTMSGGFLILFASGFLMTAVPRFTGTFGLEPWELGLFGSACLSVVGTLFLPSRLPFHAAEAATLFFLLAFCLRRIRLRTVLPPPPLVFVLAGLTTGIAGCVFQAVHDATARFEALAILSQLYFYQGLQLLLILGIGIFLIPNLLGHPTCMPPVTVGIRTPGSAALPYFRYVPKPMWIVIAVFLSSFGLEAYGQVIAAHALRTAIVALVCLHDWKISRLPKARSTVSWSLWISCWLLLLGLVFQLFAPAYDIHARHLTYIGGMGLMTLIIATRVTLSHGGHDMALEKTSKLLKIFAGLMLLAATTRAAARFLPEEAYWNHLLFAAWVWIAALILWGTFALPRLLRVQK